MTQETTPQTSQARVLIVDDDKFLLDMYSLKFSQAGYSVHPAFSVAEALHALRGGYDPAVILFDITMPGEDGFVFLQKIQEEKLAPNARLIALTNQSGEADKKHAEELGVHRYVIKASMIPSEVVQMVKEELVKK
jgi:CheY-like chemotaxis protein